MASVVRYLLTVALATAITLSAFYLMHRLIDQEAAGPIEPPPVTSIRFGPVDIPDPAEDKVRKQPERPERQEPPPATNLVAEVEPIERPLELDRSPSANAVPVPVYQATIGKPSRGGDGNARPVAAVPPPYPREAAMQGLEGWVRVSVEIDASGRVGEIRVIESQPRGVFDDAAVRAVRRWTWKPAQVNGEPRAQRVVQELSFSLDDA